jgi:hypothetical protein
VLPAPLGSSAKKNVERRDLFEGKKNFSNKIIFNGQGKKKWSRHRQYLVVEQEGQRTKHEVGPAGVDPDLRGRGAQRTVAAAGSASQQPPLPKADSTNSQFMT